MVPKGKSSRDQISYMFNLGDVNMDGKITRQEWVAQILALELRDFDSSYPVKDAVNIIYNFDVKAPT